MTTETQLKGSHMESIKRSKFNVKSIYIPKILTHFELVGIFHDVFGHPLRKELYTTCFEQDQKMLDLRISVIKEENKEFKDALEAKNLVEMADALCDLAYFIYGAGHCLGVNLDELIKIFKINISTPTDLTFNDQNILDNKSEFIKINHKLIEDDIEHFCKDIEKKNFIKIIIHLVHMLDHTYTLGHGLGFNMDLMFREVHRSNMTKVCLTVIDAETSVELYLKEGRYKEPSIKTKDQYFIVYDKTNNKILKNYKWEMPNLKQFMQL